jgi:hypothetical protein
MLLDQDRPMTDEAQPVVEAERRKKDSLAVQLALRDVYRTLAAIDERVRLYLIRG